MSEYKRLTTNKPKNSEEWLLNVAYAKNGEVYLRGVDSGEDIRLSEYISKLATAKGCHCSPEDVLNGACSECSCEINLLNILAIQSAELRNRLAELEDNIESGKLLKLPCKYDDTVYKPCVEQDRILVGEVKRIHYDKQVGNEEFYMTTSCNNRDKDLPWQRQILGFTFNPFTDWNVTVFATHKEAEARLEELKGELK